MSETAFKHSKGDRRLCQACRERKARFQYRGEVRADRDHTLCFECFRSNRDHARALRLAGLQRPLPLGVGSLPESLDARQLAHRQRMLTHLESQRASAIR